MAEYSIYTIGHGEVSWDGFTALLRPYPVQLLADIRAFPYYDAAPWFNRDRLEHACRRHGLEYIWLGSKLGALTSDGRLDHLAKEHEPAYRDGISELLSIAGQTCSCLLGTQPMHHYSHRHQLIAQTLLRQDVEVLHILPCGALEPATADLFHSRH
jgi:uncharacterized protein (DUF488 family)